MVGRAKRTLSCFVMTLSYSRAHFAPRPCQIRAGKIRRCAAHPLRRFARHARAAQSRRPLARTKAVYRCPSLKSSSSASARWLSPLPQAEAPQAVGLMLIKIRFLMIVNTKDEMSTTRHVSCQNTSRYMSKSPACARIHGTILRWRPFVVQSRSCAAVVAQWPFAGTAHGCG